VEKHNKLLTNKPQLSEVWLAHKTNNMKQILGIILLSIMCFSCKAQNEINNTIVNNKDYEVINVFFNNTTKYCYLDKKVFKKSFPKSIASNYKQQKRLFKTADSICNFSKDTLNLKVFCPLADSFRKYKDVFSDKELKYLENQYQYDFKEFDVIDFTKIESPFVLKHSNDYENHASKQGSALQHEEKYNEHPSISIYGIYYTKDKQTVIIYYKINKSAIGGIFKSHVFKKQKNIWWKPIGSIKL